MPYSSLETDEQERKLFVGGLNKDGTDEEHLRSYFKEFGPIIDCTIMRDANNQSRGFGFVLFENASSIDDIIASKKDGGSFTLDDHQIEVKRALPKVPGGSAGSSRPGGLYRKIFVGGLPSTITEKDLRLHFENFGRVNEVELLRERGSNRLRGFAFVTFDDEDSADKCIQRRTHEICKKVCEVKRAQTRSNLTRFEGDSHHSSSRDHHEREKHSGSTSSSSLSMSEVNQLIQQAFAMGQQSVLQPSALQAPTASSLLYSNNLTNPLLQALITQQSATPAQAPAAAPAPAAPPAPAANTNTSGAISQLAQLLHGRGIDPNTLTALLKQDQDSSRPPAQTKSSANGGYPTSYPTTSAYDMYYGGQNSSSGYVPSKDDDSKQRYRPY